MEKGRGGWIGGLEEVGRPVDVGANSLLRGALVTLGHTLSHQGVLQNLSNLSGHARCARVGRGGVGGRRLCQRLCGGWMWGAVVRGRGGVLRGGESS